MEYFECGGLTFVSDFDSSNIDRIELVSFTKGESTEKIEPSYEFNIWTRADCAGTEFENSNRSWFYFGIKGAKQSSPIKLNIVNLNRHGKLYNQGMAPVYKVSSDNSKWERIRDTPTFTYKENVFSLSFGYQPLDNLCATTYFAFTYPYSFNDLQNTFKCLELRLQKNTTNSKSSEDKEDEIYYCRECLVRSLEGSSVDLITISSYRGITDDREPRLKGLFPDTDACRPFRFKDKKIIFFSARVHPGETPSSFVMNGVLKLLLNAHDATAIALRNLYVFKLIPMLNPDGVSRGFYRTDTRGVNLNRVYLNPSRTLHPSVYAARALIMYYHTGQETVLEHFDDTSNDDDHIVENINSKTDTVKEHKIELIDLHTSQLYTKIAELRTTDEYTNESASHRVVNPNSHIKKITETAFSNKNFKSTDVKFSSRNFESELYLYVDFHAHATKKGIFIYGNHFENINDKIECMLLPKLMSINNHHFHLNSCNFSKRNMYSRDRRDGLSKEGCGRVAVSKTTGLIKSYTLECNYNTGCVVNILPPKQKSIGKRLVQPILMPPKYTPKIYEEVGQSLCVSILDMVDCNPNSRLEASSYRNINGVKEALKIDILAAKNVTNSNFKKKGKSKSTCFLPKNSNCINTNSKNNIPTGSGVKRKLSQSSLFTCETSKLDDLSTKSSMNSVLITRATKRIKIFKSKTHSKSNIYNDTSVRKKIRPKKISRGAIKIEQPYRSGNSKKLIMKKKNIQVAVPL